MGLISHFIPCLERLEDWTTFTGMFSCFPCSGSFSEYFLDVQMIKVPWRYSQSLKVYNPHQGQNLTNFFLIKGWYLELWVGRVWHTSITCVAEPKSGSQEVGTWSNSDLMESQLSRGEGEMNSHFWKYFWVILLNSSLNYFCWGSWALLFTIFFLKITPCPPWIEHFFRGKFWWILTLFGVDRHTVEILG